MRIRIIVAMLMGAAFLAAAVPTAPSAMAGARPLSPPKASKLTTPNPRYVSPRQAGEQAKLRRRLQYPAQ